MHKDMYVYMYVMVWVFLELQINMIVLPQSPQAKIPDYAPDSHIHYLNCYMH